MEKYGMRNWKNSCGFPNLLLTVLRFLKIKKNKKNKKSKLKPQIKKY